MDRLRKSGCVVCGKDLIYKKEVFEAKCMQCGGIFRTYVTCEDGHYICDDCHGGTAMDVIETMCIQSKFRDPIGLAEVLMDLEAVKMHGPEHHFLVPAVLLTAYYQAIGKPELIESAVKKARIRSSKVVGGSCGFHGNCGAGVGAGIFMAIITGSTPTSEKPFMLSNLLTGSCLIEVAKSGGPRCCKRDTYISILNAVNFVKEHLGFEIQHSPRPECRYSKLNNECITKDCQFYSGTK
jgi:predicted RNA-binding Zn-ribbon protein involved in translation (DUF1610 family)